MVSKTLRYALLCVCYVEVWYINHCIPFTLKAAAPEQLPDDDTRVSKRVGAAE
jgi:hypothetical protein